MTKSTKQKVLLETVRWVLHILLNIIFYILVVLIVMRLSTGAYEFSYQLYGNVAVEEKPGTDVQIQIKSGESTMDLAKKLEYHHVIVNKYSFFFRAKLSTGAQNPILAGAYTLNTSMNYGQILEIITEPAKNEEPAGQAEKNAGKGSGGKTDGK